MTKKLSLLDLNVPKLFEDRSIDDIIEIDKLLDAEIDRKRVELRSMVGDRYKDILAATEAIKCMENLSESIVTDIQKVKDRCETVVQNTFIEPPKKRATVEPEKQEERSILIQIRLAIEFNEHMWVALDNEEFCKAAQFFLLTQYVHTGLRLLNKTVIERYKLINKLKDTLDSLRTRILRHTNKKLQTVQLSTQDTCSNLNALMLLENYTGSDLLHKFIDLRKNALKTVIETSYPSVRAQVSAMVKCLYTTVHLLHDCFLNYNNTKRGLIWHQLEEIVGADSLPTLSKIELPECNLINYIPDVIKQFRPHCNNVEYSLPKEESIKLIEQWVSDTSHKVIDGLKKSLELVPNVKGLHIIREEALKADIPANWEDICLYTELPKNFSIWHYFFQDLVTSRTTDLLTKTISNYILTVRDEITDVLSTMTKDNVESDLRSYVWQEDNSADVHASGNRNSVLCMKTRGFSTNIVRLCEVLDVKYSVLLEDVSLYMYGKDRASDAVLKMAKRDNKNYFYHDCENLELHIKQESVKNIHKLAHHLKNLVGDSRDENFVTKSIVCARFLYGLTTLCPNLTEIMSKNSTSEWDKLCNDLCTSSLVFWENWINDCNGRLIKSCDILLSDVQTSRMLSMLCRWDTIEIQEQTDEKTFKSKISVPMKTSTALQQILDDLCEMLNAVLPHTLPKRVHLEFIERNASSILKQYEVLLGCPLNQTEALQFLFDVKFLTTFCIPRENMELVQKSQDICDKLRSFVDPFDLDVFYKYLQHNVKQNVLQSQVVFGSLLPSSGQLSNLGLLEKNKEHEKEPSILALSTPAVHNWFLLLPVTAPVQKSSHQTPSDHADLNFSKSKTTSRKPNETASGVRSGAAALFGAMTTDWFS